MYDCYDAANIAMKAVDRQNFLIDELNHKDGIMVYDNIDLDECSDILKILQQDVVVGWDNMMKYHDQFVEEGFLRFKAVQLVFFICTNSAVNKYFIFCFYVFQNARFSACLIKWHVGIEHNYSSPLILT